MGKVEGVKSIEADLQGKSFELTPAERRCLELQLEPVRRLRAQAERLELRALLEARAFAVERLGLPENCQIRILRANAHGVPIAFEVVGGLRAPEDAHPAEAL